MIEVLGNCAHLLRCPKTGQPLAIWEENVVRTADDAHSYAIVREIPILVDFDRSVLEKARILDTAAASLVERPSNRGAGALIRSLMSPPQASTRANIELLRRNLAKRGSSPLVLVIGGGTIGQGMEQLYDDPAIRILAFDIYCSVNIQFVADAHAIPLRDGSVDAVIVQAVLEHVLEPERVVGEIWRVLGDGGLVYAETPFLQHVHEGPYDFTRFTESGHRYLFRRFALLKSGVSGGAAVQLLWSIDYFFRSLLRSRAAGKAAKLAFSWLRLFDRLIPQSYASDAASGVHFLGVKAHSDLTPHEAVRFYRGAQ